MVVDPAPTGSAPAPVATAIPAAVRAPAAAAAHGADVLGVGEVAIGE